jgi:hypothetical protein
MRNLLRENVIFCNFLCHTIWVNKKLPINVGKTITLGNLRDLKQIVFRWCSAYLASLLYNTMVRESREIG